MEQYAFFLNHILFSVPPSKITTSINGKNKTVVLLDGTELNELTKAGLTDISFNILLPMVKYPFARYDDGFKPADYYLSEIKKMKMSISPFQFDLYREKPDHTQTYYTEMTVSLEDYKIIEDAESGLDVTVEINLKQYIPKNTTVYNIEEAENGELAALKNVGRSDFRTIPEFYTAEEDDTLYNVCRRFLGTGDSYKDIAKINGFEDYDISKGQVIKFG